MKKAVKKRWMKALRSGEFEQGTGWLRSIDNTFCPLGVVAKIEYKGKWKAHSCGWSIGAHRGFLPDKFRKSIELSLDNQNCIIELSDDDGLTFPEIADWIEANL